MIHMKIYGIPDETSQDEIMKIESSLKLKIAIANEISSPENRILISFVKDGLKARPQLLIFAEAVLTSDRIGKTKSARDKIAREIRSELSSQFDNATGISCSVMPFNKKAGISSIHK